ncbi:MAG: hypothetical protein NZZ41_00335 [Candidatus Dojkabacteria bacterium]|nr:hypothetical protein [Candidatus Dojkabacteria bacterium]
MKKFISYLIESLKIYEYKIKFCFEPSEEMIKTLAIYLQKYDPIELTEPERTIIQKNPLDFPDVENTEIFIMTFKTHLPLSSYILEQEIKNWLCIPEKYVVVRSKLEPMNVESDIINSKEEIEQEAEKNKYHILPKLSSNEEYPESEKIQNGKDYFSNEQVENLKLYMRELKKQRINGLYALSSEIAFEINKNFDDNDFNKSIKDAPKSYHRFSKEKFSKNEDLLKRPVVNVYDDFPEMKKEFLDKDNKIVTLKKTIGKK